VALRVARAVQQREGEEREPGASRPGAGRLAVARVAGRSALVACAATSPLHLFTPRAAGEAVWAIATTHGGGLLAGDEIELDLQVGPGARALYGTLSNTRVYRSTGALTVQRLTAEIAPGATLGVLPEPTACFAGARFRQEQRFALAPGASLLLLDAFTEGRGARGERWAFEACLSRNVVEVGGRLLLADGLRLVRGEGPSPADRMAGMAMVATLVALGPAVAAGARRLLERHAALPVDPGAAVFSAASPLGDGVLLRLAAPTVAAGAAFVRESLAFAAPLFGGDPFQRRP